jgi:outer membrane biosynthesis protein TonB
MALPLTLSLCLHAGLLVALLVVRTETRRTMPQMVRVEILAAPPGDPAIGVVNAPEPPPVTKPPETPRVATKPPPKVVPPKAVKAPPKTTTPTRDPKAPARPAVQQATPQPPTEPVKATPVPDEPPPKAAGGDLGGKGADVATVQTPGVDLIDRFYAENIVRLVRLGFHPPRTAHVAIVRFLIHRDGTIDTIELIGGDNNFAYKTEALSTIQELASKKAFGALPTSYPNDVLPIVFTFDQRIIR